MDIMLTKYFINIKETWWIKFYVDSRLIKSMSKKMCKINHIPIVVFDYVCMKF